MVRQATGSHWIFTTRMHEARCVCMRHSRLLTMSGGPVGTAARYC
ncbi:hypothetical protein BSU04_29380 [Caballeronia sordidicola]|uniref:Uncharacterized protein n=1 Tax=Caballeronia sordidicola TaxID=196367 RepID=A0A226WUP0_CABSO|nr:hypothetical protein BSU04_29380 [Caballeronia sordidicola]